ncbi:RHOMBOID-like protein 2 isoform X2 [Camellia sinensis]|uniref:RHOMBOID-like protein 2 isoform X2 n=1 Tax=Camellia sinensis TaxID=4442 RepID=UPI00103698E0|nr:RHOMBOID-like protein 2 isoform X2 [Camellia sinensis]
MSREDLESRGAKISGGNNNASSVSAYVIEERDAQWTSWLIPMFVVVNVALFVVAMYINDCPKHKLGTDGKCVARFLGRFSFQPLNENPLFGPSSSTLEKLGALEWTKVVHKHQAWRLITCIWVHAGIIHLLVNMLCLVFIGIRLEQQFGFGFGGSILSALFLQKSISVGASGALFGLLGAMLSELITNWTIYTNKVAALLTLIVIVVINLGIGILPHVDNFAHIGGFVSGFFLGFILLLRPQYGWVTRRNLPVEVRVKSKYKPYQYVLWSVSLILLVAGFAVGLVMLFRGVNANDHCHWCHYLSCVPTSKWKCDGP